MTAARRATASPLPRLLGPPGRPPCQPGRCPPRHVPPAERPLARNVPRADSARGLFCWRWPCPGGTQLLRDSATGGGTSRDKVLSLLTGRGDAGSVWSQHLSALSHAHTHVLVNMCTHRTCVLTRAHAAHMHMHARTSSWAHAHRQACTLMCVHGMLTCIRVCSHVHVWYARVHAHAWTSMCANTCT